MSEENAGTIEERLHKVIKFELGDNLEIKPESKFIEDLGADSLGVTELIMNIEEEFDIEVSDEDSEKLTTVGAVLEYLEKNVAA